VGARQGEFTCSDVWGLVVAGLATLAVLAVVPSASGHPEECAAGAAWTTSAFGFSPYTSWEGAEEAACTSEAVQRNYDDSSARLTASDDVGTKNLKHLANRAKPGPFAPEDALNSDLAFENGYAYAGNYNGIQVFDVRDPENPTTVAVYPCLGAQNDVTVNDGILVTSTDALMTDDSCNATRAPSNSTPGAWEGLKVFDVSNPAAPQYLTSVETDCGSHTHTVLPEADRLIVYVQSYDVSSTKPNCQPPHDKISVVEVPKSDPAAAAVVNEPVLFPDGGNPGEPGGTRRATTGCHDITVYQEIGLAAGACTGQGSMIDISDPVNPKVISSVEDPNFAFWHSATISNDGKKVLFTDELGGGSGPECNPTVGPQRGADAIYDITDPANPRFLSYFKIPRTQTNQENCVAHNGNLIPIKGRDVLIQSWYQGGVSVLDWTDGSNPKEIAWFDRGPINPTRRVLGGFWSSYYYNGYIYGNEIQRGFDVFKLTGEGIGADRNNVGTLNAQTQYRYR
jgi:hypothetical protein